MRTTNILILLVIFCGSVFAQEFPKSLQKVKDKYRECRFYAAAFDFVMEYPNEKPFRESGNLKSDNNDFDLHIGSRRWIAIKDDIYFIDEEVKEVNISNFDPEDDDLLTPKTVLERLDTKNFEFYEMENEGELMVFDLKPLETEDYFKIRLKIKSSFDLHTLKVFNKDGSRMEFVLNNQSCSSSQNKGSKLEWRKEDFSDFFIEDLRID